VGQTSGPALHYLLLVLDGSAASGRPALDRGDTQFRQADVAQFPFCFFPIKKAWPPCFSVESIERCLEAARAHNSVQVAQSLALVVILIGRVRGAGQAIRAKFHDPIGSTKLVCILQVF